MPIKRKVAERLADVSGIDAGNAVERAAARAAVEIKTESRLFPGEISHLPLQHLIQVVARALAVAHREDHRLAFVHLFGDAEYAFVGIDADDVADQIFARRHAIFTRSAGKPTNKTISARRRSSASGPLSKPANTSSAGPLVDFVDQISLRLGDHHGRR